MPLFRSILFLTLLFPTVLWAEPLRLFTAVAPIQIIAEHIGAKHVVAQSLVKPGFDPHHYEPTPQQIRALSNADLYVRSEMPFEQAWLPRIQSANPGMQIVGAEPGTHVARPHGHHEHGEHPELHRWTSPAQALEIAKAVSNSLSQMAPQHAGDFARNLARLREQFRTLDAELKEQLGQLQERHFLVFHPAWDYFAEAYGLHQIAIEHEGKQPGARTLAHLIEEAREQRIRAVLVQPQMDTRLAQRVAGEIGAQVITIDPLADDYPHNLRRLAQALVQASRHD